MTWVDLSKDCLSCAQRLFEEANASAWRSAISRSYYAAYCAAASMVCAPGTTFANGWQNPPHAEVPRLIGNVGTISLQERSKAKRSLRILLEARIDADYRPGRTIIKADAHAALREAATVLQVLGVLD